MPGGDGALGSVRRDTGGFSPQVRALPAWKVLPTTLGRLLLQLLPSGVKAPGFSSGKSSPVSLSGNVLPIPTPEMSFSLKCG